jgi:hypothetical protein
MKTKLGTYLGKACWHEEFVVKQLAQAIEKQIKLQEQLTTPPSTSSTDPNPSSFSTTPLTPPTTSSSPPTFLSASTPVSPPTSLEEGEEEEVIIHISVKDDMVDEDGVLLMGVGDDEPANADVSPPSKVSVNKLRYELSKWSKVGKGRGMRGRGEERE